MTISELCTAFDGISADMPVAVYDNAEHYFTHRSPNRKERLMRMPMPVLTMAVERFRVSDEGIDVLIEGTIKEEE